MERIAVTTDKKWFVSGGVLLTSVNDLLGPNTLSSNEWVEFKNTWKELPVDRYMNDGGTYRQRRFSRFHYQNQDNILRQKEHAPYSQPLHLNPLNGGVLRHFDPFLDTTVSMDMFRKLISSIGLILCNVDSSSEWDINAYQNRTIAGQSLKGQPVPEGMHRDGVRYSVLVGVNRDNVSGAESTLFDDSKKSFLHHTIQEGDVLVFCDEITYHDTTAVELNEGGRRSGFRDVMVVEYYTSLGNENQVYVK